MASSAKEWREKHRKEVALPSGLTVEIRKLTGEFIMVTREIAGIDPRDEAASEIKLTPEQHRRWMREMVRQAVTRPRVAPDGRLPAEDEVEIGDFGPDFDALVGEIMEFNPFFLPAKGKEGSFRGPGPAGEGAPRPGGDVRGEAERVAAGPAGGPADGPAGA